MKYVLICVLLFISCLSGSVQLSQKKVLIDTFHSAAGTNPEINMAALPKVLPEFTFEVKTEPLTEDVLQSYDVIMMVQPHGILQDSEIQALTSFVFKGGGLIICGEQEVGWSQSSRDSYNKLGRTFGVTFTATSIDDPTHKKGCYCTPIIHNMIEHPITEGVAEIVLYKPCALWLVGDNALPIARGDDDTHTIGTNRIMGEDVIAVAVAEYGRGRVVVVGSTTIFDDSFINQPDNQTFCVNILNWVSVKAPPSYNFPMVLVASAVIAGILIAFVAIKKR
ncbi:MAG: ThuA domain-containing protein [Theionarchaea archaeon]|nr:ThuA domain-containing protein [Theionarchaea archaeon]